MNTTTLKGHVLSALITFIAAFALAFCSVIVTPSFTFGKDTIIALVVSAAITAVRVVAKLVIEWALGVTTSPVSSTTENQ